MNRLVLLIALVLVCAAPAPARAQAPEPLQALLLQADSPEQLRAGLIAFADSAAQAGDRLAAGAAYFYAGLSFQHAGMIDTAIACHRHAADWLGGDEQLFTLTDQLMLRRRPGDVDEAVSRLLPAAQDLEVHAPAAVLGRLAWARFLQNRVDSADVVFARVARQLATGREWRYRIARVALARKDYRRGVDLLIPLAVASRGSDDVVVGMLEDAGKALGMTTRFRDEVGRTIAQNDRVETALADSLHGRLIGLTAGDGFPLGGLYVPPAPGARARRTPLLAVVLMEPGDTLALGDSLATALRRHGLATLLLPVRGSGASVAASCPTPESWLDREQALQTRVARDVNDAVRSLRRSVPVDTTRYVVVGVGATAAMAAEAAYLDRHVKALMLVSPAPSSVERGPTRARLAAARIPVFFQSGGDDYVVNAALVDALYQAGNRPASRVVEASDSGRGLALFRANPTLAKRFLTWLDGALAPATAPRPTPRAPRR